MVNRARRGSILSSGSDAFFTLNDDGLSVDWLSGGESGKEMDGNKYVTPYMSRTDDKDDSWFSEVESNSVTDNDDSSGSAKDSARRTERKHSDDELREMFARTAGFFSEFEESDAETFSKPKRSKSSRQSERRNSKRSPKKTEKTCLQFDTTQAMRVPQGMNDVESDALLSEFETDNAESKHQSRREKMKKKSSKDSSRERRRTIRDKTSQEVCDSEFESDRESPSRRRRRPQRSSSGKYDRDCMDRSRSNRSCMDRSRSNRDSLDRSRSSRTKQQESSRSPKQSLPSRSSYRRNDREHANRKSRHSGRPSSYGSDHPQSDHEFVSQRKSRRSSLLGADPAEESNSELDFSKHSHARSPRHSIHNIPSVNRPATTKHEEDRSGRRVSPRRESRSPKSPRRPSTKKSSDPLQGSRHGPSDGSKCRPERNKHRRATMAHIAPNLIVENVKKKYGRTGCLDYPTDTEDESSRMDDSVRSRRQRIVGAWKEKEQFKAQVDDFSDVESQSCTEEDQHRQDILNLSRKGPIRASSRQRSGGPVQADTLLGGDDIDSESDFERSSSTRLRRSSLDNGYGKDSIYGSIDQIIDNRRNRRLNNERDETPHRRTSMDPSMKTLQATIESSPQKSSKNLACDNATQTSGKSQNSNNSEKSRKEKVSTATVKDGQSYDVDELLKARRLRGASQRTKEQKKEAKKFNPMEMLAGANVFNK